MKTIACDCVYQNVSLLKDKGAKNKKKNQKQKTSKVKHSRAENWNPE